MEIPHPSWAEKAAGVKPAIAAHRNGSHPSATLALAGLEKASTRTRLQVPGRSRPDTLLSDDIDHIFLLGQLSYQLFLLQMNEETHPDRIDPSRVPRREMALQKDTSPARPQGFIAFRFPERRREFALWKAKSWDSPVVASVQKIEDLRMTSFKDLSCPKRHTGCMVVGKVLNCTVTDIGIALRLEDPSGLVLPVQLSFPTPVPCHGAQQISDIHRKMYSYGVALLIKEPQLRYGSEGGYVLAVDVPTDIVELPPSSPVLKSITWTNPPLEDTRDKTWEQYKLDGNEELKNSNPIIAIGRYTTALRDAESINDPHKRFILHLNRAQANLELHLYGAAYRDAAEARKLSEEHSFPITAVQRSRAAWRFASAAYGLRLYDRASELAEECRAIPELGKALPLLLKKIAARKAERDEGRYDWMAMLEAVHESPVPSLDVADYTGPVEARAKVGGGHGLFVTRDVRQGELLFVSKALACFWPANLDFMMLSIIDQKTTALVPDSTFFLLESLIGKFLDYPSLARLLEGLPTDSTPHPATFADAAPRSESERLRDIESAAPYPVDRDKLCRIVEKNLVALDVPPLMDHASRKRHHTEKTVVQGLFGFPRLAKEVCWGGNFTRTAFGDVAVFRAAQDLSQGTELLYPLRYSEFLDRAADIASLRDVRIFDCACDLCEADQEDDWLDRVGPALEAMEIGTTTFSQQHADRLEEIAVRMAGTYSARREAYMKPELANLWRQVAFNRMQDVLAGAPSEQKHFDALDKTLEYFGATRATPEQIKRHGRAIDRVAYPSFDLERVVGLYRLCVMESPERSLGNEASTWARTQCWIHHLLCGGGADLYNKRFKLIVGEDPINLEGLDEKDWP
ncbi:hypothetical protein IAT38_003979 [Cryptococcus sp. DSM 104549]